MSSATPADKFQPSWIRSTFHGPGAVSANTQRLSVNDEDANIEPSVAILAKNRYGREEVLQLQPKPIRAPYGLSNCSIFVAEARGPTVMMQMSEIEQRLQMNINSSKAMSSLNPTDRTMIVGGGSSNGPNSPQVQKAAAKNEWTPVKSTSTWSRGAAVTAGGGGTPTATMNGGRGGLTRSLGRGTPLGQTEETGASPYGQKYVPRGRGGTAVGRGQSFTAGSTQVNSRAQGLYDPRDPKDRPRNRLRSTSDDTEPSGGQQDENGGWTGSRFGRQNSSAWSKEENSWNQSEREGSFTAVQKKENGGGGAAVVPEWFEDADEGEKPLEPNAGSFDDDGRYRKEHQQQGPTAAAPRWRPGPQEAQHHSTDEPNFPTHRYVPQEVQPSRQLDYFYLDPTEVERGPFQKDQMYTWYQMNYFADTLKVRTNENPEWKTLGELKSLNGTAKPFDYKPPAPPQPLQSSFSYPGNAAFGGNLFGGSSPWGEMFTPGHQMFAGAPAAAPPGASVASAFDDKSMLAEKQRFDMQKMQEMHEIMRVAQEQKRIVELKELEFRRQQEELRKKFDEEMLRKQMEQLELQKKLENLEAEKNARLEEERRRQEEEQEKRQKEQAELKRLEEEKRRVLEEAKRRELELRKKEEEIERKRQADRAAEEHRQQLLKKAEEDAQRIQEKQAAARREEEERKAAKDAERMFSNEDVWKTSKASTPAESLESPWQTAPSKKSPPQKPKAAAWSSSSAQAPREKTLREIQEEEERQQLAEARELARQRKEQESSGASGSSAQSALWSNVSQRINWIGTTAPIVQKAPGKPAWGGAGVDSKPAVSSSINWDGPSLQAANKIAPTPAPAPKKASTAATAQQKHAANVKNAPKNQVVDVFTQWVTKRLKEINKNVDADVLSSFLESVENPNEVEDYVQEYLGESKIAKEFVKEYLQKRCESRKRRDTGKDDLSCARYAGTGTGGAQGKKKKGKGARLVVDGSCLGFRATGDPNRVNQGEIETVPLPAAQKR